MAEGHRLNQHDALEGEKTMRITQDQWELLLGLLQPVHDLAVAQLEMIAAQKAAAAEAPPNPSTETIGD